MKKFCRRCSLPFEVSAGQLNLLARLSPCFSGETFSIPEPTLCPQCRLQRRLSYRNQLYVYQRQSSFTGKRLFSSYSPDAPVPVISREEWWSDNWDALTFGCRFDFNRSFFSQFAALKAAVPHISTPVAGLVENCDYCNNIAQSSNCYLVFATAFAQDCMYCESVFHSKSCLDCTHSNYCELCYECTACNYCYNLQSSAYCDRCSDSFFLFHCKDCEHCYGCANLRHQRFCIFNRPASEAEYRSFISQLRLSSYSARKQLSTEAHSFWHGHPIPHAVLINTEESSGNFLVHCRNVRSSFFIQDGQDLEYCYLSYDGCSDCLDSSFISKGIELCYEFIQAFSGGLGLAFCQYCVEGCSNLYYCSMCVGCDSCFGCIGLRKKSYCILNRQFSKADYEALVSQIIKRMCETGEWGEFFPLEFSPVPYNHSFASRFFPMPKAEVYRLGGRWYDKPELSVESAINSGQLPDGLPDDDQPIIVLSELSSKPFRITAEEISRYRSFDVPLPRMAYDERMNERSPLVGALKLFERSCPRTGKPLLSPWGPDMPWIIWDRDEYSRVLG